MIRVQRFVNQLLSSNCFIVFNKETNKSVVIDPGSEKSEEVISFVEQNNIIIEYIILTHEHIDHNWGVNALKEKYPKTKLIYSERCVDCVKKSNRVFFSFYFDRLDYTYTLKSADVLVNEDNDKLYWDGVFIHFIMTPGHSKASMCININGLLFTGDTIMPYPRYLNKKDGNIAEWRKSIELIISKFSKETIIYPGHGDSLSLGDWIENNKVNYNIFSEE